MSPRDRLDVQLRGRAGPLELNVALETTGTLAVTGPNGAGKSSLLAMLLGTRRPAEGWIRLGETTLLDTENRLDLPIEQRRWGYVPQSYALFPHLSVRANVAFGIQGASSRADRQARTDAGLKELGLTDLASRRVQSLSGGERQRVALARALASGPRGLLLDEPLAALDVHARQEVRRFLTDFLARVGLPTIIVTHDLEDARMLGKGIAVMERGQIIQRGTWEELRSKPATAFVQAFVQSAR